MDNSNYPNPNLNPNPNPKPILVARDWLTVAVLTSIMTLIWIAFGVYQTLTKSVIPEPVQAQVLPLQPQLDEKTLNDLEKRVSYQNAILNEDERVIVNK